MNDHGHECGQIDDAAAYVLGALDEAEVEAFREHLVVCDRCRREVADLQPAVDLLAASPPRTSAPGALRDRVMSVVESEAALLRAAGHEADRPPRPRRRAFRLSPLGALAAAAAMVAGVVIGLAAGDSGGTHVTRAVMASTASGSATLRQSAGHAELDVTHLSQAPAGRVYEVWLQRSSGAPEPTDALFVVDRSGNADVAIPGPMHGVRRLMVTDEPVGGSSAPTTAPLITVPLSS